MNGRSVYLQRAYIVDFDPDDDTYLVHYDNTDPEENEWVEIDRIQFGGDEE